MTKRKAETNAEYLARVRDRYHREVKLRPGFAERNREKAAAWYAANSELAAEQSRIRYESNREQLNAKSRDYYWANREHLLELNRRWREANRDRVTEYRQENAARIRETRVRWWWRTRDLRLAEARAWQHRNADHRKEYSRAYHARYKVADNERTFIRKYIGDCKEPDVRAAAVKLYRLRKGLRERQR